MVYVEWVREGGMLGEILVLKGEIGGVEENSECGKMSIGYKG